MRALLRRFAVWLLRTTDLPVPHAPFEAVPQTEPVLLATPSPRCDTCGRMLADHACPAITVDGDIALCACCGHTLPKGTVKQHTGEWVCLSCKSSLTASP